MRISNHRDKEKDLTDVRENKSALQRKNIQLTLDLSIKPNTRQEGAIEQEKHDGKFWLSFSTIYHSFEGSRRVFFYTKGLRSTLPMGPWGWWKKISLEDTAYCLRNELSSDLENQDEAKAKWLFLMKFYNVQI